MDAGPKNLERPLRALKILVVTCAGAIAIYGITRALWLDDTHSTFHAFAGPGHVMDSLRTDSHPPLYFFLLSIWMRLGGMGEAWLRLPSILFTWAAAASLFLFARRTLDATAAWLTVLFFLFHPVVAGHLHTVRPYALLGLESAVSTVLYTRLAQDVVKSHRRARAAYVLVNVMGTFTHYWYFLLLAAQGVGAMIFGSRRARLPFFVALAASVLPFAILGTPLLLSQLDGTPTSWLGTPGGFWFLSVPIMLLGASEGFNYFLVPPAKLLCVLLALSVLIRFRPLPGLISPAVLRAGLRDRKLGLWLAIPVAVMAMALVLSQIRPIFEVRYTIILVPALALVLAGVFSRLGERGVVALVGLAFVAYSLYGREYSLRIERGLDNRIVTQYLVDRYEAGDRIVHITLNYAPTLHYLRFLSPETHYSQTVFPAEVGEHPGWRDRDLMLRDGPSLRQEAALLSDALAGDPEVGRIWVLVTHNQDAAFADILVQELERNFRAEHTEPLRGWFVSEIRMYVRR